MSTQLIERLMDVVEAVEHPAPDENFVRSAFALLALAISRLPRPEREATLRAMEDGGALRRAVELYPDARAHRAQQVFH
jgi:hypothetical protein